MTIYYLFIYSLSFIVCSVLQPYKHSVNAISAFKLMHSSLVTALQKKKNS